MPARQESCCFTGHRPAKLPWGYNESDPRCVKLKERIADAVLLAYQEGYRHFLCCMARAATSISVRRCWPCGSVIRRSLWRPPFPVPLRRTPGRRRSGIATGNWLPVRYGDLVSRHLFFHLYAAAGPLHGGSRHAAHRRL